MSEPKWNMERIHKEIYDARTKMFVISKVLETGSLKFSDYPEWALVVRPLLKEMIQYAGNIQEQMGDEESMLSAATKPEPEVEKAAKGNPVSECPFEIPFDEA
jgi:hypothetical protein